ncbi:Trihelix transcription factor ASIL2 [Ananas comosus]|uniref:Trihelix transcription factor ASIL2 n=1 Tax=Ananas comosus TaxID=4615 RepID=A0A199V7Q3_ANACO|nr:Trihelix transcription factor ASIL2 [Ananas comosus]
MDDTEDDARYPPKPRRAPLSSSSSRSFHRPKPQLRDPPYPTSQFRRPFAADLDPRSDDDDDDDPNGLDPGRGDEDDEVEPVDRYRKIHREHDDDDDDDDDEEEEGEEEDEDVEDGRDSPDSRGKRRRIDRYALGFEFAPRVTPAAPAAPAPSPAPAPAAAAAAPAPASASTPAPARGSPATDWSEESTLALLEAWGDRFVQNERKSIRAEEWSEVARKVAQAGRVPWSESQCRNRVDTLKKKYKKEKARLVDPNARSSSSSWIYFKKMDELMSPPSPPPPPPPPAPSRQHQPPPQQQMPQLPIGIYEKMEHSKRQQMAELERMRKDFQRELEVQKRQILERAQAEIAKIREEEGEEDEDTERTEDDDDNDEDGIDASAENLRIECG